MNRGPRGLAVEFLGRTLAGGRRSDALGRDRRFLQLDPRDRRLTMELARGALRRLLSLDHRLAALSSRPLGKLDPDVLGILRVAVYELVYLRTPARAVVHEAVGLCRGFGKSSAGSFVNAVLRRFQRERPVLPKGNSVQALSIRHSHPEWLVRRYLRRWGPERAAALMRRNNERPRPCLWVNPFKVDFEAFQSLLAAESVPFRVRSDLPNCLEAPARLARHRLYREGHCFFMDAASQETVNRVDLGAVRKAGDFCAAPGGKAFLLASRLSPGAWLCASDSHRGRLSRLRARAGICRVPLPLVQADLTRPAPFRPEFDFVLLDVPCSGLGTLGANPEIRWRVREEDLPRHHRRQLAILGNGFAALRPQGRLLYSTCSTEPEENERVLETFLRGEPKAVVLEAPRRNFPEGEGQCFFSALVGQRD